MKGIHVSQPVSQPTPAAEGTTSSEEQPEIFTYTYLPTHTAQPSKISSRDNTTTTESNLLHTAIMVYESQISFTLDTICPW